MITPGLLHELREFDTPLLANTINFIDPTPTHEFYLSGEIQSVTQPLGPTVGVAFTAEQRSWLDHLAEHIATSLAIDPDEFQDGWFGQQGGYGRAFKVFGDRLQSLLVELNERLAA